MKLVDDIPSIDEYTHAIVAALHTNYYRDPVAGKLVESPIQMSSSTLSDDFLPATEQSSASTPLTCQQRQAIETEDSRLHEVLESLAEQRSRAAARFDVEGERARQLTADLVAARRAEEKQLLASDEAVSHALQERRFAEIRELDAIALRPYFARIELEEEVSGKPQLIEYKIGYRANSEARIIDWRKAPLSRLYYNYAEGDSYFEEIQGRERTGTVVTRNRVDIDNSCLRRVHCRLGSFERRGSTWHPIAGPSRTAASYAQLPPILSLITAEQFALITDEHPSSLLIQGVAGSGKTTVALYRLSYLANGENQVVSPEKAAIVVRSLPLREYIRNSLAQLDLAGVPVYLLHEWYARTLGLAPTSAGEKRDSLTDLMGTLPFLLAFESATEPISGESPREMPTWQAQRQWLYDHYHRTLAVLESQPPVDVSRNDLSHARQCLQNRLDEGSVLLSDLPFMVRLRQLQPLVESDRERLSHLIIDEAQDLSLAELWCLISSAKSLVDITIVGDTAQQLNSCGSASWTNIERLLSARGGGAQLITLQVSHRSTAEIMRLAAYISGQNQFGDPNPPRGVRHGRVPIWFQCPNEESGVETALEWLSKARVRYPHAVTAVLTSSDAEARQLVRYLQPTFGEMVRLGDSMNFSFAEGLLVTPTRLVKGLEFCNVLIWNPSRRCYPPGQEGRSLLTIAATRAEENLAIVSWQAPSPHLPPPNSHYVRSVEIDRRDKGE